MTDAFINITDRQLRRVGFQLAAGVVMYACVFIFVLTLVALLQVHVTNRWRTVDATDLDWRHRSGFVLRTDYGTGCQYLQAGDALVPRLDATGKPVCGVNQ
jgi:hypothetical protein